MRREGIHRIELNYLHATITQPLKKLDWRSKRANTVVNDVDLDARRLPFEQQISEFLADFPVLENIGFQIDAVVSATNGRKHGVVGFGPSCNKVARLPATSGVSSGMPCSTARCLSINALAISSD